MARRKRRCTSCGEAREEFSNAANAAAQGNLAEAAKRAAAGAKHTANAITYKVGNMSFTFSNSKRH